MPLCQTCHGEYVRQACLCPQCETPLGRGINLCHTCGKETAGVRLCPRCKNDVSVWERENFSIGAFMNRWGALGLLPSLGAIGVGVWTWLHPNGLLHPLITLLSVAVSQLTLILLYITRLSWRDKAWATQIYAPKRLSLLGFIVLAFIGSLLLGVIAFVLYRQWGVLEVKSGWQKATFGGVYTLAYLALTAAFTLLAIQDYLDQLDERVPPPLFANTEQLLRVAVETMARSLAVTNSASVTPGPMHQYEVLEVVRLPKIGGLQATLREYSPAQRFDENGKLQEVWAEHLWKLETDRWGRILSLIQSGAH